MLHLVGEWLTTHIDQVNLEGFDLKGHTSIES
jgi:hypothetical protein